MVLDLTDRSPGEFYQLDLEMSFVEQEDIFNVVEKLMINTFKEFSDKKLLSNKFLSTYKEAMLKYGSDKPDLRNPLEIKDITEIFSRDDVKFEIFKEATKMGSLVRCIVTKNTKDKPRSFLIILINGLKNKEPQDLHTLQLKKIRDFWKRTSRKIFQLIH